MAAQYIGNNDFRGYLNYQSQNGDPIAGYLMNFVGGDYAGQGTSGLNVGAIQNADYTHAPSAYYAFGNPQGAVDTAAKYYSQWQGANGQTTGDPATVGYYQDAANSLQKQYDQLDPQQAIGLQNIANSFNLQGNRLDQQKAAAQRDYNTGVQQNTQSYLNNRNGIMQNTRTNTNALQRLLGINGAGNSSAAYEQAPYAAALQGSQQLNGAQQTFGNNQGALDTNWQDTQRGYSNAWEDLKNQRYQQENGLRSSIAQTRASLLDQIGQARAQAALAGGSGYAAAQAARSPYQQQIDSLLSQITNLSNQYANPVLRAANVSYNAPNLANYFLNGQQAQTAQGGNQDPGTSDVNPTFLGLLSGQRDQYGNLISA